MTEIFVIQREMTKIKLLLIRTLKIEPCCSKNKVIRIWFKLGYSNNIVLGKNQTKNAQGNNMWAVRLIELKEWFSYWAK